MARAAAVVSLETLEAVRRLRARYAKPRRREIVFADAVELGGLLADVRESCRDNGGGWYDWLAQTGISPDMAERLMNLFKLIKAEDPDRVGVVSKNISLKAFLLLAAPSTPQETREEIFERAASGEQIHSGMVRRSRRQRLGLAVGADSESYAPCGPTNLIGGASGTPVIGVAIAQARGPVER